MERITKEMRSLLEAFNVGEEEIDPLASEDVKTRLRKALTDTARTLGDDDTTDIKSVEVALQETIERVTGMPWYEATTAKIFWDLLEHHSVKHAIDEILDKFRTEQDDVELVQEDFSGGISKDEAAKLALQAKEEDPTYYAILYGAQFPGEKRPRFFYPIYVEDEDEMRHRVGSASRTFAIYNKRNPSMDNKESRDELIKKLDKLYNRYHDYVDGEYTSANAEKSRETLEELRKLLVDNGFREEEIKCIEDAMNLEYNKEFIQKILPCIHSLNEDTVKQGSYWVNKGKEGTHGKFKTKKEADAQRRAMYARGFKEAYGSEKHPEQDAIEAALKNISGTEKVVFDYRPNDGIYAKPEDHLIVLVFTDNMFAPRDEEDDPDDENWYKNRAKWKRLVIRRLDKMGWELEDPAEDNDTYLYLVLRKKKVQEGVETVVTTKK